MDNDAGKLAQAVREACVRMLISAYEGAGMSGLCDEGRIEYAVGALREMDLSNLVEACSAEASVALEGPDGEIGGAKG